MPRLKNQNRPAVKIPTSKAGRKLFDGKAEQFVLEQLKQTFSLAASDKEACVYAQISVDALLPLSAPESRIPSTKKFVQTKTNPKVLIFSQEPSTQEPQTTCKSILVDPLKHHFFQHLTFKKFPLP